MTDHFIPWLLSSTPSGITCRNIILRSVFILETLPIHLCQTQRQLASRVVYSIATCLRFAKALWIATASLPSSISWQTSITPSKPLPRGFFGDIWIWSSIVSWVVDLTCENVGRIKTWNYILYTIPLLLDSRFFPFGKAWCSCCSFWQMRSYESEHVHSSGKSIHATQHNYEWKNCAQHRSH